MCSRVRLFPLALLAGVVALAFAALSRINELCAIRVRLGEARLARGRAPSRFLEDVRDIAHRAELDDVTVRVVSEGGKPRLVIARGVVGADVAQRLRNALGQHQVVHFRTGRRSGRQTPRE